MFNPSQTIKIAFSNQNKSFLYSHLRGLAPGQTAPKKHGNGGEPLATLRPILTRQGIKPKTSRTDSDVFNFYNSLPQSNNRNLKHKYGLRLSQSFGPLFSTFRSHRKQKSQNSRALLRHTYDCNQVLVFRLIALDHNKKLL